MLENRILSHLAPEFTLTGPDAPPLTVWGVWIARKDGSGRSGWVCNTGSQDGRVFFPERAEAVAEIAELRGHDDTLADAIESEERNPCVYSVVKLTLTRA